MSILFGLSSSKNHPILKATSGIGISTIKRIETFNGIPKARIESIQAIHNAFMETGKIRFEDDTCVCVDEESD